MCRIYEDYTPLWEKVKAWSVLQPVWEFFLKPEGLDGFPLKNGGGIRRRQFS